MSGFFVTGGTLKPDAPSYIPRDADKLLYEAVLNGEYCNVLTTRQMGKSSLMAQTAERLRNAGIACATVDLQGKGDASSPPEQWYYGVVKQIASGLELSFDLPGWWKQQELLLPAQRMTDFFADVVLKQISGRVVVFIDEVDWMIKLKFSDEFFAAIRSCFNRRASEPVFDRLTFVLLGSAAPAQLIRDATRTPFNIGRGIELTDFTPDEAGKLAPALGDDGEVALARILHWTDGHPYLTQMLCSKALEKQRNGAAPDAWIDSVVNETLLSPAARQEENNLKFVADRLTQATGDLRGVLKVYRQVWRGKPVKDAPASAIHTSLRLSGAVKPDADRLLRIRNRVYRQVFNDAWVRERLPSNTLAFAGSGLTVVLAVVSAWYLFLFPKPYIEQLETATNDVPYEAYFALQKPFHRTRANDLFAQFWERRGDRDQAILVRASGGEQRKLASLVGSDYPSLVRTFRHGGAVFSVAFSPNGKLVATGSGDNTARVFQTATGREVSRLAHQDFVYAVTFSPDGTLVATGSRDNTARVFQAATGREVSRLAHKHSVSAIAFSPDGVMVATGSADNTARVFQAATGREVSRLTHRHSVFSVAFSSDGKLVATGSDDNTARVFQAATGREVSRLAHQGSVSAVAFSPDGTLVATGSDDNTARVFQAATGREVSRLAHQESVSAVAFSPDGALVATSSHDKTARVFQVATGREVSRLAHRSAVSAVAFSPDGALVATGSADNTARVFQAATGREVSRLAHQNRVYAVAFSPDGKLVASGSSDNTARLFPVLGREVSRLAHQGSVYAVAFSPDGKLIATGSADNTARVSDVATGAEISRLAHQGSVYAVAFSPDGKLVATGSSDNTARVFQTETGREISRLADQFWVGAVVNAVAFKPDGRLIATGSADSTARVFQLATGREVSRLAHQNPVNAVAFSPDGKFLATQTGNWLHLYRQTDNRWRPVANRHLPVIWNGTLRFTPPEDRCRCVEIVRDVPENMLKLERINFDEYPQGNPSQSVAEWSVKLGLTFDSQGRIQPQNESRSPI